MEVLIEIKVTPKKTIFNNRVTSFISYQQNTFFIHSLSSENNSELCARNNMSWGINCTLLVLFFRMLHKEFLFQLNSLVQLFHLTT
jgi:hypothetical protein